MRELRIARAEDAIGTERLAELRLHGGADIDIGQHAEAFLLERLGRTRDRLVEGNVNRLGKMIAHVALPCLRLPKRTLASPLTP